MLLTTPTYPKPTASPPGGLTHHRATSRRANNIAPGYYRITDTILWTLRDTSLHPERLQWATGKNPIPFAALIDWCGPFHTIEAASKAVAEHGFGEALYMAIGSRRGQTKTHLQYVGITKDLSKRFNGKHPIQLLLRPRSLRLYVGIVTS